MGFKMMGGKSPKAKTGAGIPLDMKSPLYENEDPTDPVDRESQVQKRYPGAVKRKNKVNEYTYKGTTLVPGYKQGKELSDADKIKKSINEQK